MRSTGLVQKQEARGRKAGLQDPRTDGWSQRWHQAPACARSLPTTHHVTPAIYSRFISWHT